MSARQEKDTAEYGIHAMREFAAYFNLRASIRTEESLRWQAVAGVFGKAADAACKKISGETLTAGDTASLGRLPAALDAMSKHDRREAVKFTSGRIISFVAEDRVRWDRLKKAKPVMTATMRTLAAAQ